MTDVLPTRTDPDLNAGSEWIGGPAGTHLAKPRFWTPLRVIIVTGAVTFWLGVLRTIPCMTNGWVDPDRYEHLCYTDIPILYSARGLADGLIPYLEWPDSGHPLEYPILIGAVMWLAAALTRFVNDSPQGFFIITMLLMFPAYILALVATARTVKDRVWDGLLLALAPSVVLAGTINWDWAAIGLTALALWLWSKKHPAWAGVALGFAIAAKFYPLVILGPLLVLCLRSGRLRAFFITAGTTAAAWAALNLPVAVANSEGWGYFFRFSAERGQDFGSIWLMLSQTGLGLPADSLNTVATGLLVACCAGIAALILMAKQRPRLAQVAFLVVAAFILTNKVYSPQFVLWLLPLAILARPRWRDIMWWQAAEAIYFVAIWWYLVGLGEGNTGLPEPWYAAAILVHVLATLALVVVVVRDVLRPDLDPVRSGTPDDIDDPGGGVLDRAPDRFTLRPGR